MGIQTAGQRAATPFAFRLALAGADIGRFVAPVLVGGWLALLVLLGKPNSRPDVYDTTVLLHGLFAAAALAYAGWLLLARRLPGPTRLDWCAFAVLIAFAVSIATSVNPRVSLEASLLLGMAILTFYVVHDLKGLSLDFWARALMVLAALISVLGLLTVLWQYTWWLEQVSAFKGGLGPGDYLPPTLFRVRDVLNHPSPFAMFLNLALPFAAARAIGGGRVERKLAIAVLLVGLLAVFFSLTRGAWMATAAWAFVFALLAVNRKYGLDALGLSRRAFAVPWLRLGLVACVPAFAAAGAAMLVLDAQPDWLFRATLDDRLEAVTTAFAIFGDHWLTGAGPYTYLLLDDAYATHDSGVVVVVHAHNVYVQVLTDLGVLGGAAVLLATVMVCRIYVAAWRAAGEAGRLYVAAAVAATVGFMVHGLSDAPPSWNSVFVPFAVVVAIGARLAPLPTGPRSAGAGVIPRVVVLALLPVTLVIWLHFDAAHQHYDRSIAAFEEGRLEVAASEAVEAADADSGLYAYSIHAGVLLVRQYQESLDAGAADPALLDEGISRLEHAVELDSRSSLAYANLALAFQLKGERDRAVEAAYLAIADEPGDADVYAAAGWVFEWAGLRDAAVDAYAEAVSTDATLTQAPFWAATPDRMDLRNEVLLRSGLDACEVGSASAIYGAYTRDLARLASECAAIVTSGNSAADNARLALILQRLGDHEGATEYAMAARDDAPLDKDVLLTSALVLSRDLAGLRLGLVDAQIARQRDAKVLLLASYLPGAGTDHGLSMLLVAEPGDLPPAVAELLPPRGEETAFVMPGEEASSRSITYYAWGAQREAPVATLIPGPWTAMVSPRTLLAAELSERLGASAAVDE